MDVAELNKASVIYSKHTRISATVGYSGVHQTCLLWTLFS
jgi:hypothetical protein